jgi:hypothetical protein
MDVCLIFTTAEVIVCDSMSRREEDDDMAVEDDGGDIYRKE